MIRKAARNSRPRDSHSVRSTSMYPTWSYQSHSVHSWAVIISSTPRMASTTMVGARAPRRRLPVGRAGRWGKAKVTGLPQVASTPPPADGSAVPGRPGRWEQRPHRHPGSHIDVTSAQSLDRVRRWAACPLTPLPPAPARPRPPGTWPTPSSRSSGMSPAAAGTHPDEALAYLMAHPDRQDVRMAVGVLRSGESWCAVRTRANDDDDAVAGGRDLVPGLVEAVTATFA